MMQLFGPSVPEIQCAVILLSETKVVMTLLEEVLMQCLDPETNSNRKSVLKR